MRGGTRPVVVAADPALDDKRLTALVSGASLTGARAQALAAAAVRADIVERHVQPALDAGSVVVMERFVDSPLAHLSAVAGLDSDELEGLADWATGRLRPDLTVLLDAAPPGAPRDKSTTMNDQWRVQHLLTEMAAADPDRYVVIDADGSDAEVAERIRTALRAVFVGRLSALAPTTEKPATLLLDVEDALPVETAGRASRGGEVTTTERIGVWNQLVGQEPAVETLSAAAAAAAKIVAGEPAPPGAMTHAWLLTGPPGSGRSVAARTFAAAPAVQHRHRL